MATSPKRKYNTSVITDLAEKSGSFYFPILLDIKHPGIEWDSDMKGTTVGKQENGHLRLINDIRGVMYKGDEAESKWYASSSFNYTPPKEDGKAKNGASVSIMCPDSRIIEVIRSITEDLECRVVCIFAKVERTETETDSNGVVTTNTSTNYVFSKLSAKPFYISDATVEKSTVKWSLDPDRTMDLSIPRDVGTKFKLPAIIESK